MFEAIVALIALSLMEIVLGIDNIVFISVATSKLPPEQQRGDQTIKCHRDQHDVAKWSQPVIT